MPAKAKQTPPFGNPLLDAALNKTVLDARENEERAHAVRLEAEKALRLARGTGDVREQAEAAVRSVTAKPMTLAGKIEAALRTKPRTFDQLVKIAGEPAGRISNEMKKARANLRNLGTNTDPVYVWYIGDDGETAELKTLVCEILRVKAMTLRELELITGAGRNRISGVLVKLQVAGVPVENLGNRQRAVWHVKRR